MERAYRVSEVKATTRLRKRRHKRKIILGAVSVVLIVVTFFVGRYVVRLPQFQIQTIAVTGNVLVSTEEITATANAALSGYHAYVIPKSNRYVFSAQAVREALASTSPRIKNVNIEVSQSTLSLTVEERTAHALWCQGSPPHGDTCFLLDEDGFVFAPAPMMEGGSFIRWFGGTTTLSFSSTTPERGMGEPFVGWQFLGSANGFSGAEFLLNELATLQLKIAAVAVSADNDWVVYLVPSGHILLGRSADLSAALSSVKAILADPGLGLLSRIKEGVLLYLDVRFGSKIVYKIKEETNTTLEIPAQ